MSGILGSFFTNWKTTLLGVGAAVTGYLGTQNSPGWQLVSLALVALLGIFAKDSNVTGGTVAAPK